MQRLNFKTLLFLLAALLGGEANAESACTATYATRNDWATGFVVDVVLTNSGATPVRGWKVSWSYDSPVKLTNPPWGATVRISGGSVVVTDNGWNPSIAPGGKISFGMALTYSGRVKPQPSDITVSGEGCLSAAATPISFYTDPDSNAAVWVRNNPSDYRATAIREQVAANPAGKWFGGWSGNISTAVDQYVGAAAALKKMPILVAYNIPGRDCGQYSAGGANAADEYQSWISAFAAAIGVRKAVVILEPDALPQLDCLNDEARAERLQLFRYAVEQFSSKAPNALLYLDAGNSTWLPASVIASRLIAAGVATVRGFSLNVSNYQTTGDNAAYGNAVNAELMRQRGFSKSFVIDTSRNGNGPYGSQWCDPPGRKLGATSRQHTDGSQPEMTLWIKMPGEADGCLAPAGSFVPDAAYKLIYGYY
ncbi:MAG TPA: glycoside hydrolase family 6 protein [Noviherbaspirillum sp.]|nr:glycoside hydrolase family 6 protein [Noviherbaspirillum sp.]